MPSSAVIFDMDGVLIDSEPLHLEAANDVLRPYGELDEATNLEFLGATESVFWEAMIRRFDLPGDVDRWIAARHARLVALFRERLPVMRGVRGLVERLAAARIPMAVASSSERDLIDHVLEGIGLQGAFSAVASGDEVVRPKPDPEIFRLAAERLGVPANECVVIEDSPNGIRAARAAGMRRFRVVTETTRHLAMPPVDGLIEDFDAVTVEEVLGR